MTSAIDNEGKTGPSREASTPWLQALDEEGRVVIDHVEQARSLQARMRGLLGRDGLPPGHGLLLDPCGSIHTLGMRFAIDVVFLAHSGRVLRVARRVRPGRLTWAPRGTRRVLETAADALPGHLAPGQVVLLRTRSPNPSISNLKP